MAPTGALAAEPSCPCSIWAASATPANPVDNDPNAVELGVKFRSDVAGFITGVRFWKGAPNTGTHTGNLWSSTGQRLATAGFTGETASGWQQVTFSSPVAITANTVYVASYHTTSGNYAADADAFASAGVDNGPLHALASGVSGNNGVYAYGSTSQFPTSSWRSANYWVDVVFTTAVAPPADTTPPTVTATSPANGATGVAVTATVTATFSEPLDASTVSGSTVQLSAPGGAQVAAAVTYDAPTRTARLTPTASLAASTTYTATLRGGATSPTIRDVAGNALAATHTRTFTTAAAPPADTTPPTVTATSPASGATGVAVTATVTATFSEPLDASTVSGSTVQLSAPGGAQVAATVTYDSATRTARLTPTASLAAGTTYTATLRGGATSPTIRDVAGNALAATHTRTFTTASGGPCATPANPVVAENCLVGNPASEWDVTGIGDASIQGFATDISVNRGSTVQFKITTTATAYLIDIYRLGYYGGLGARKVATIPATATTPRNQPSCLTQGSTGLVDCGNWSTSATWNVPANATSGIYIARPVRSNNGGASHIPFIVRDDASQSALVFQTSDTTWQAYNTYGGNSFYQGSPAGRAYKVSYNRPFTTRAVDGGQDWIFNAEYPMVRWLEGNGYDTSYISGLDTHRSGALLSTHGTFLSVGHDEYWSGQQRSNVEAARDAGVNLAFFSGNEVYWKTRWEPSIDGSATANRTLVCYKETHAGAKIDPTSAWTGTWRDPRFSPPADGGRPENALTGTAFLVNDGPGGTTSIRVPEADGKMRLWRNTTVANQSAGATATLPNGTLGYEWDADLDNGVRPPGLIRLSSTTVNASSVLQDYGSTYAAGTVTHNLTLYRQPGGGLVFGAGTVQWSWGLDATHDRAGTPVSVPMQQATVNLLADMAAQPATIRPGLTSATPSTDTTPATAAFVAPPAGAVLTPGTAVSISGTASDVGGRVGGVEVSTDGGATWHPATGRGTWSYSWTPTGSGTRTLAVRATDDSANTGAPLTRVVTVGTSTPPPTSCPCSIWAASTSPGTPVDNDPNAVELGVKFRSDVPGFITGVRFWKGTPNNGTHTGNLWSSTGQRLATAVFTGETASGWQQVAFSSPVAITANTTYVASYHTTSGNYAADADAFATSGVDNGPLHALANGVSGSNGVYAYGSTSQFPTSSWRSSNYWVDVVFTTSTGG